MNEVYWVTGGIFAVLLAASLWDIRRREIHPWMMLATAILSGCSCFLQRAETGILMMAAALLPGAVLLLIALVSGQSMGYGDGLLAICAGPGFGLVQMVTGVFFAFFFSALWAVMLLASKKGGRKTRIPFVPMLTLGLGVMQLVS